MSENWQYQLQVDCLKKILLMYCLPFAVILYSCSHILTKGLLPQNFASYNYVALASSENLYYSYSMDSKCREESARLLGCLIRSCARLILPYIAPIHKVSNKQNQCYSFLRYSYLLEF